MNSAALELNSRDPALPNVLVSVLWTLTFAVGLAGVVFPYARPAPQPAAAAPLEAQTVHVALTSEPAPVPGVALPEPVEPPSLGSAAPPPDAPALVPVAEPSLVAFALPVEGPVRIVAPKQAAYVAPAKPVELPAARLVAPPVQQITYGQGEGRQPAPEYPYRARREGQEGVVKIRFLVGENGRVISAEPSLSSPWPLLNQSALRVVLDRWQFRPGPVRQYEVSIRFQLTR